MAASTPELAGGIRSGMTDRELRTYISTEENCNANGFRRSFRSIGGGLGAVGRVALVPLRHLMGRVVVGRRLSRAG